MSRRNSIIWLVGASLVAGALAAGGAYGYHAVQQSRLATRIAILEQSNADLQPKLRFLTTLAGAIPTTTAAVSEPAPPPTTSPSVTGTMPKPKPSFVTYAYVKKVTGPYNETFTIYIDPFEILTGSAATNYANAHGQVPPSNGILLVNSSSKTTAYPLAEMAAITANVGSVEDSTLVPIEPGVLQSWVSDHTVIPGALSDMWQVTVKKGVITAVKMIAIAD